MVRNPAIWLVVSLFACGGEEPLPPALDDTAMDAPVATDTGGGRTPTCDTYLHLANHAHTLVWAAPDGRAVAAGALGSTSRDRSGSWTDDPRYGLPPQGTFHLGGASTAGTPTVVAVGEYTDVALRDEAAGGWRALRPPFDLGEVHAVVVDGHNEFRIIASRNSSFNLTVSRYDGGWSRRSQEVGGEVNHAAALPDGRLVLGTDSGVLVKGEGFAPPPGSPAGVAVTRVAVGSDESIVGLIGNPSFPESSAIVLGDVRGLAHVDPGFDGTYWVAAAVRRADDIWLAGNDWQGPVVVHYDGVAWQTVPLATREPLLDLAMTDDGVVAVAGSTRRQVALAGDVSGLQVELDQGGLLPAQVLAVDDVDGSVWGVSDLGAMRFDGATWEEHPPPFGSEELDWGSSQQWMAVTGGRFARSNGEAMLLSDGSTVSAWPIPEGEYLETLAGAGGVFFAAGVASGPDSSPVGYLENGSGWLPVDMSGVPEDADILMVWVDGPEALWVVFQVGRRGGLASWDGRSWTVHTTSLPTRPTWMRRLSDGLVWVASDGLHTWDGRDLVARDDLPEQATAAYRTPDGTLYVRFAREGPRGRWEGVLARRRDDGTLEDVLVDETVIQLVGHEGLVVAASADGAFAYWCNEDL